jgi:hypothetical protein
MSAEVMEMQSNRDGPKGKLIPFPSKLRNQSLARKLAIERQAEVTLGWVRQVIEIDRLAERDARELGISVEEYRPVLHEAFRRRGKLP